jgi:glucose/arabinose dehydrogenase
MAFVMFVLLICLTLGISQAWKADPPYYGRLYADVGAARGLFVDPVGDLLVLERHNNGRIFVIYETENGDGSVDVTRQLLVSSGVQINHSVIFHDGYIYAASQTVVLRWPYTPGSRQEITIPGERVIDAIPNGGHDTRSLIFDSQNRLYVSIGSGGNVDSNSDRARIRRFNIVGLLPIPFDVGEVHIHICFKFNVQFF